MIFVAIVLLGNAIFASVAKSQPVNVETLCSFVGFNSGCSGCVFGTHGLCTWVQFTNTSFPQDTYRFLCVPSSGSNSVESDSVVEDANYVCASDPRRESIIPVQLAAVSVGKKRSILTTTTGSGSTGSTGSTTCTGSGTPTGSGLACTGSGGTVVTYSSIVLQLVSTVNTTFFNRALFNAPGSGPYPVDRTSLYGAVGEMLLDGVSDLIPTAAADCAHISSDEIVDLNQLLVGRVETEHDKFCVKLFLAEYLSTRCPQYGVAVSGICQSFATVIDVNCGKRSKVNVRATLSALYVPSDGTCGVVSVSTLGYPVVPDGTAWCLSEFPVTPNGHFEHIAGLDRSIDELADPATEVVYGC